MSVKKTTIWNVDMELIFVAEQSSEITLEKSGSSKNESSLHIYISYQSFHQKQLMISVQNAVSLLDPQGFKISDCNTL